MKNFPISIVIPVYKNYEMFYRNLETNKVFFEGCEVIVMNDFPGENITSSVKQIYRDAITVNNRKNLGFAGNVNKGILQSKNKYVFLINSDVLLEDDSFLRSLDLFDKQKDLFAVGFAQKEKDGKVVGSNRGYFKNGLISHSFRQISITNVSRNFWAEGGASVFRKDLFIELGMMDELFNPFYWEDIDLSYRAWKSGYQILFYPDVLVEHQHESTIGKFFNQEKILKIAFRNQLIFQWKNLTDKDLILKHLFSLPKYFFTSGFFDAFKSLPKVLKTRKKSVKLFKKTDKEILRLFEVQDDKEKK